MTQVNPSSITGITTTLFTENDVVNKTYVDNQTSSTNPLPSQTGNANKFLVTTDGTNLSWDFASNEIEYTNPGIQTFTPPNYSNLLYIEAVGAGAGGHAGTTISASGNVWTLRTTGNTNNTYGGFANNLYFYASLNNFRTSTDSIHWTVRTVFNTIGYSFDYTSASGGLYMIAGSSGYIGVSTNGIVWIARTNGISTAISWNRILVTSSNNHLIAGDFNCGLAHSTDTIIWTARTVGAGSEASQKIINAPVGYVLVSTLKLFTSTDAISWVMRTAPSPFGFGSVAFSNNLYIAVSGSSNTIVAACISTDSINWTARTTGLFGQAYDLAAFSGSSFIVGGQYNVGGLYSLFGGSTDGIVWTARSTGISGYIGKISRIINASGQFFASGDSGYAAASPYAAGGSGGSSGSYTSWYIPRTFIGSNITINVGQGGIGATVNGERGGAGSATTISWTGLNGNYFIFSSGASQSSGGSAQTTLSDYYYSAVGCDGAPYSTSGVGNNGGSQTVVFQPTGGGSGAGSTGFNGGNSGLLNIYGINVSASAGSTVNTTGSVGLSYTGFPCGTGGGGGASGVSIAGTGGNGVRGGGGGGGAINGSNFGPGGNGGNGYVKIVWW